MSVTVTKHGEEMMEAGQQGRLYIERKRVDYGGGISFEADWFIARPGGTPYAWGSTAEELAAWARENGLKAVIL